MIERVHLILKNIIGEFRANHLDALFGQSPPRWISRPDHGVDMGVMTFIVEGGIPAEPVRRNLHGFRYLDLMSLDQFSPALRAVIAKPGRVFPPQGPDKRPHVSTVLFDFPECGVQ